MISEEKVLSVTRNGLEIYAHILRTYYPGEIVLEPKGMECKLTRNPFNDNKPTLYIWQEEGVFFYNDTELAGFKGNPFDFAYLHYGLTGQVLLEKLIKEMCMVITQSQKTNNWTEEGFPTFSFFYAPISNINPGPEITILDAYKGIKSKRWEYITSELRLLTDPEQKRKYKAKNFNYVCFSGTFSKRGDKYLKKHSGLLCLDFDHVTDISSLQSELLNDAYFETQLMFISPSGDGLKWIIDVDLTKHSHLDWFNGIYHYIQMKHKLEIDKSGKDVSRACFLPYDPNVYINPKYHV